MLLRAQIPSMGQETIVGPGPAPPSLSTSDTGSHIVRAGHKRYFFDLGSNNKGQYLRITEVRPAPSASCCCWPLQHCCLPLFSPRRCRPAVRGFRLGPCWLLACTVTIHAAARHCCRWPGKPASGTYTDSRDVHHPCRRRWLARIALPSSFRLRPCRNSTAQWASAWRRATPAPAPPPRSGLTAE